MNHILKTHCKEGGPELQTQVFSPIADQRPFNILSYPTKESATKSFTRHIAKWATIGAILKQPLSRPRLLLNLSPARGTGPGVRGRLPHPAYLGHNVPAGLQRVNGVRV